MLVPSKSQLGIFNELELSFRIMDEKQTAASREVLMFLSVKSILKPKRLMWHFLCFKVPPLSPESITELSHFTGFTVVHRKVQKQHGACRWIFIRWIQVGIYVETLWSVPEEFLSCIHYDTLHMIKPSAVTLNNHFVPFICWVGQLLDWVSQCMSLQTLL